MTIGYGTFVPRKGAHRHIYGPVKRTSMFTFQAPLCGTVKWSLQRLNRWDSFYLDYETKQEAAQTATCPKCLRKAQQC